MSTAGLSLRTSYSFDAELLAKDAYLVAASAAAQVASAAKVIDVGEARFDATAVIDVSAIEIASNNELYRIAVQGSSSPTFASDVQNLAMVDLGATEVRDGGAIDSTTGRLTLDFTNCQNDVIYRYLRVYTFVSGSVATGINFTAFFAQDLD